MHDLPVLAQERAWPRSSFCGRAPVLSAGLWSVLQSKVSPQSFVRVLALDVYAPPPGLDIEMAKTLYC